MHDKKIQSQKSKIMKIINLSTFKENQSNDDESELHLSYAKTSCFTKILMPLTHPVPN